MGVFECCKGLALNIVEILLDSQPVTAKQIYFKLKKRYGISITYQGLHKKLVLLEQDGVLKKDDREYCIDAGWLDSLEGFANSVRSRLQKRERFLSRLGQASSDSSSIKVVSFDLNGAVFSDEFDELLLRWEIPRAYAKKYGLSNEEAFERVTTEYRNLWRKVMGWRDPEFWIKHFKLDVSFDGLVDKIKERIATYIDAAPVLKSLSEKYHLIMISHAQDNVISIKLKKVGLDKVFFRVFSTGSYFRKLTKDADVYREVCEELRIRPDELAHVGNDFDLDYRVPASVGIHAFFIDRQGRKEEPFVVRDLYEFEQRIRELERLE